jgi:hypothetical protein
MASRPQHLAAGGYPKITDEKKYFAESTFGTWWHVIFTTAFLMASVVLVLVCHTYDAGRRLDFVTFYDYTKAIPNTDKAISAIEKAVEQNSWLNDKDDSIHCLNMAHFGYPVVSFAYGMGDPTSATCKIGFTVKPSSTAGFVVFEAYYIGSMISCMPSSFPLEVNGVVQNSIYLTITGGNGLTNATNPSSELVVTGSYQFDYAANNEKYNKCRSVRLALASDILTNTSCEHADASPMCSCIQTFTSRLTAWNGKIKPLTDSNFGMRDVLVNGVKRCVELRRSHDVRKPVANSYARSRALLIFAIALLFNALYKPLMENSSQSPSAIWDIIGYVGFFAIVLVVCLVGSYTEGQVGEYGTAIAMVLPSFLVFGGWGLFIRFSSAARFDESQYPIPYSLTPVCFDLCLCALTLFTLVERGVVQTEYLVAQMFGCHAVTAIYIAITWFHRLGAGDEPAKKLYQKEGVQYAYAILYYAGLGASLASLIAPFAGKTCFELHWLLPGLFTMYVLISPSLAHWLKMETEADVHRLTEKAVTKHTVGFTEIAGFVFLAFGFILWLYFLEDHLQIYGAVKFPYPSVKDPLAPVVLRAM